jgi:apolipoprotein N-acyltransferase
MVPYLAVVTSALVMWAAFPPLDLGPLAFVALIPFFWAVRRVERGFEAAVLGFLWGAVFFGTLLWWIKVLGFVAWFPLTLLMASWVTVYALVVWLFRLWPAWRWWLIVIGAWVIMEFLRSRFPFGGFPWGSVGYASGGFPPMLGSVQWIGPAGWSMLAVALGAAIALVIDDRENWRIAVDTAVLILLLAIAGSLFAPSADGATIRVAIVQGGSPCPGTHCQNEARRIYEQHLALTETIPAGSADLVIWAENSTTAPYEPENNDAVRAAIIEQASRIGASFLVSGTRTVGDDEFVNVNVLFSPEGVKIGEYHKLHPVPFGEYVPLRGLLGFVPQLDQVPRDMIPGTGAVVFPFEEGTLGSVISFEGAFARNMRLIASAGSQVMVVATNEASYGVSPASDQLIGMVQVNAAAIGQDVAHAAITGKSTFVQADGSRGESTELLEETVLHGELQMRTAGPTMFTRFPFLALILAVLGIIAAFAWPGEGGLESVFNRPVR